MSDHFIRGAFYNSPQWPIHGCRYLPTETTTGWYIWAGKLSDHSSFFKRVHTIHLETWAAEAIPYLGLPPGWRFLIAPGHEDLWFDDALMVQ